MITCEFDTTPNAQPLYVQLYTAIKQAIEVGEIKGGDKLPSKRALAANTGVSVITIEAAYNQLIAEGYITSAQRRGYFATELTPTKFISHTSQTLASQTTAATGSSAAIISTSLAPTTQAGASNGIPVFSATANSTIPATDITFPYKTWTRYLRKVITKASYGEVNISRDGAGTQELRRAIAAQLRETRAMYVDPAQVIIGAGSQILYAAIIQLLGRDKIYAAENPGYPLLKKIYELNGAKFAQINIDAEGISVDELSDVGAHVAHVMPQHHLPTGIVMSAPRRTQLLAWEASSPEHYIIEDDYDCELRFAGRPITPLAANDPTGRVIYTNTFTKTMGNVFRVGYMVLPPALLTKFYDMLGFYSPTVGILDQLTLADFIDSGAYTRHVRRVRTRLKKATQVFVDTLQNFPTTQSPDFIPVFHAEGVGAGAHFSLHASNTGAKALKSTRDTARQFGVNIKMISDYILENNAINDTKLYTNTYIIDCSQASVESAKGAAKAILENL